MKKQSLTPEEKTFVASLVKDSAGRIVYTYRGGIERGVGGKYIWKNGYSATTQAGYGLGAGVLYPWMTRKECLHDAACYGCGAVFSDERTQ